MSSRNINDEQRQSISLSRYAEDILQSDIWTFGDMNYSSLVNRVIENYCGESDADIYLAVEKEKKRLGNLLDEAKTISMSANSNAALSEAKSEVINRLAAGYRANLVKTMHSYSKDITKKYGFGMKPLNV